MHFIFTILEYVSIAIFFRRMFSLEFLTGVSVVAGTLTYHVIPKFKDMFIKANLFGVDLNKSSDEKVPEATGVITG